MSKRYEPAQASRYDVVIIGGAMYGSSVAWWLTNNPDFNGSVLVVERDPTYEFASTSHTNSCIRQQFTTEVNVRISQFGAEFIKNFRRFAGDEEAPDIVLQSFGYMYLADNAASARRLAEARQLQADAGAHTRHMKAEEIADAYPFYNVRDIVAGNHNTVDEGYFDGGTIFDWWRKKAKSGRAEYCTNEVVGLQLNADGSKLNSVELATGDTIACGLVVNCSGTRAAATARKAGIDIPVEPRKRFTFVFDAEQPLEQDLPLTIDPSGVHFRTDGRYYMAGCSPAIGGNEDPAVAYDDFSFDHSLWENEVWPIIANRIPQFEAIKLVNSWTGHYAYNTFDQNAIVGPHSQVINFFFANGFSGHGLQQAPAIGRGLAEWITYGEYRSIDLTDLGYDRIEKSEAVLEKAII